MAGVNIDIYEEKIILEYEDDIEDISLLKTINEIGNKIEPGTLFYEKKETKKEEESKAEYYFKSISFIGMFVFFITSFLINSSDFQFLFYLLAYLFISGDIA